MERNHLEDLSVDDRFNLKSGGKVYAELTRLQTGIRGEHVNGFLGYIKGNKFQNYVSNYQVLKRILLHTVKLGITFKLVMSYIKVIY
jgi:hypothetical protein